MGLLNCFTHKSSVIRFKARIAALVWEIGGMTSFDCQKLAMSFTKLSGQVFPTNQIHVG